MNSPSHTPNSNLKVQTIGPQSWLFWIALIILVPGGLGFLSILTLLKLPKLPNCDQVQWATASASLRLHCAEMAAQEQTGEGYLEAIEIVNALPMDHPLRPRINQSIEDWAENMLVLGDMLFEQGKLQEAIATAQNIPSNTTASGLVNNRLERWRALWEKAEGIYEETEALIRKRQWTQAFRKATRLLEINNVYWSETRYQELTQLIQTARRDGQTLVEAEDLADLGTVEDLLKAIALMEKVEKSSYLYGEAQNLIRKVGRQMMELAQEQLELEDAQGAIAIAAKIPATAQMEKQVEDFTVLAKAHQLTWSNTVSGLEKAIAGAQQIDIKRPLYGKAQYFISRWQRDIEDVARLEKARHLASSGGVNDLAKAVAEVSLISTNAPRYEEASTLLNTWNAEIQTIEDRPYLNRAESLAIGGTLDDLRSAIREASMISPGRSLYHQAQDKIDRWQDQVERIEDRPYLNNAQSLAFAGDALSLQSAINEARRISPGRALYPQAQEKIRMWTNQLELLEDRPYLDRARNYANMGDLSGAIATAGQISPGRALSGEANDLIDDWQWQLRGRDNLQTAQQIAAKGSPEDLAAAINRVQQVPWEHPLRQSAEQEMTRWGQQLLNLAQARSSYDLPGAIAIAAKIPPSHSLYSSAQSQITVWEARLAPPIYTPEPAPPEPDAPESVAPVPGLEVLPISNPNSESER
ncbi:chromosome segregation ATPase [Roseofilum sp. BLCC_M91]|uniref:Chromosome segregation ATPase n=1 Tax=Roseofilum halophilum BLCC-M91 TaxID=3022259 RepID=A0ABT7BMZ6_9CYAN|nr:hypothetical protein [Roseofilum halophilum]MDJ1180455.1 chromosome segregation ATPase [Roseofilum halophilum BLCC-M91]